MNLAEYQVAAERTMIDPDDTQRMLNAALGLCGEAAEIFEIWEFNYGDKAALLGECGDMLWYVAQMCKSQGESIGNVPPDDSTVWSEDKALNMLWKHTGHIADITKKYVFHKKPVNMFILFASLEDIVTAVDTLLGSVGYKLKDACNHNTEKLLKRFPNGFNYEDANKRMDEQTA